MQSKDPALVAQLMGIEYIKYWNRDTGNNIWFGSEQGNAIDIEGYDRMIRQQYISFERNKKVFTDFICSYRVNTNLDTFTFMVATEEKLPDSLWIDLYQLINQLLADYGHFNIDNIPPEKMTLYKENQHLKIKLYFRYIRLKKEEDKIKPIEYSVDILYKTKND
ncbi:MAG: hypothetical protein P8048_10410 [Calditrichia bacterium]